MSLFSKRPKESVSADLLPTYYAPHAKDVTRNKEGFDFQLVTKDGTDLFEIWYSGGLTDRTFITNTEDAQMLVIAKAVSNGQEIIIHDGYIHGYDNMAWQEHAGAGNAERELKKLDIGAGRVFVHTESLPDDEGWEKDENGLVTSDHGRKYEWEIFKRDAIGSLSVSFVTEKGKKFGILDEELA